MLAHWRLLYIASSTLLVGRIAKEQGDKFTKYSYFAHWFPRISDLIEEQQTSVINNDLRRRRLGDVAIIILMRLERVYKIVFKVVHKNSIDIYLEYRCEIILNRSWSRSKLAARMLMNVSAKEALYWSGEIFSDCVFRNSSNFPIDKLFIEDRESKRNPFQYCGKVSRLYLYIVPSSYDQTPGVWHLWRLAFGPLNKKWVSAPAAAALVKAAT